MEQTKKPQKVKVRGTGTYDPETNEFGFKPFDEAPSTQKDVKSCAGGGKRWVTTGVNPSKMITLKSKQSSPDQYSDFLRQFNALTKDLKPKKPVELPTEQRVVNEQGLQCWLDEKNGTRNSNNWQAETLRLVQLVVRRLPACEQFNKVINLIKIGGNK